MRSKIQETRDQMVAELALLPFKKGGLLACMLLVMGCSVMKHVAGTDQCMAPTAREAKITKKVWM